MSNMWCFDETSNNDSYVVVQGEDGLSYLAPLKNRNESILKTDHSGHKTVVHDVACRDKSHHQGNGIKIEHSGKNALIDNGICGNNNVPTYACEVCNMVFENRIELAAHESFHVIDKPFQCPENIVSTDNSRDKCLVDNKGISGHNNNLVYACQVGNTGFENRIELTSHAAFHVGDKQFQCPENRIKTENIGEKNLVENSICGNDSDLIYLCKICNIVFETRIELAAHEAFHVSGNPLQAPEKTDPAFHVGDKPLQCLQCHGVICPDNNEFLSKGEVCNIHVSLDKFSSATNILINDKQHIIKEMTGTDVVKEVNATQCPMNGCKKFFKNQFRFNLHVKRVHGERKYQCTECNKIFKLHSHLKEHSFVHINERPFVCPVSGCDRAFKTQAYAKTHKRRVHEKDNSSSLNNIYMSL